MPGRPGRVFQRRRLRYDSEFHTEVAYCTEHGIPHSQFLQWPPEDRAKAIAFMMEKAARCTRCGTADWEWDEDAYAYMAIRQVCRGCQKLELVEEDPTETKPAGSTVVLIVRALAERLIASQQHSRPTRRRRQKH